MKKLTKKQRIDVYQVMMERLQDSEPPFSLCNYLNEVVNAMVIIDREWKEVQYDTDKLRQIFPEFYKNRPKKGRADLEGWWWKKKKVKPRVKYLNKLMDLLLEELDS